MTKDEIISAARQAGACREILTGLSQKGDSLKTLWAGWAYWLRIFCKSQLDANTKARLESSVCKELVWAFVLRLTCDTVSANTRHKVIKLVQDYPEMAYALRSKAPKLTRYEKWRYAAIARKTPGCAFGLLRDCHDLSRYERRKAKTAVRKGGLRHLLKTLST